MKKRTRSIPLTSGEKAKVDAEDFARLSTHRWHIRRQPQAGALYAVRQVPTEMGKRKNILMQREVMRLESNDKRKVMFLDPRSTLDCRKSNLKLSGDPDKGKSTRKNNGSGFNGVSLEKSTGKWMARWFYGGRRFYVGVFATKEEAVKARRLAIIRAKSERERKAKNFA